MDLPQQLQHVVNAPGMYLPAITFDNAVSFLEGYDSAANGSLLCGFREWLVPQVGEGANLAWSSLVLRLAFPGEDQPRERLKAEPTEHRLVGLLFSFLEQFSAERSSGDGLHGIYLRYRDWLKAQEWCLPDSPEWIDLSSKLARIST